VSALADEYAALEAAWARRCSMTGEAIDAAPAGVLFMLLALEVPEAIRSGSIVTDAINGCRVILRRILREHDAGSDIDADALAALETRLEVTEELHRRERYTRQKQAEQKGGA
jgi:hypothetical protein